MTQKRKLIEQYPRLALNKERRMVIEKQSRRLAQEAKVMFNQIQSKTLSIYILQRLLAVKNKLSRCCAQCASFPVRAKNNKTRAKYHRVPPSRRQLFLLRMRCTTFNPRPIWNYKTERIVWVPFDNSQVEFSPKLWPCCNCNYLNKLPKTVCDICRCDNGSEPTMMEMRDDE